MVASLERSLQLEITEPDLSVELSFEEQQRVDELVEAANAAVCAAKTALFDNIGELYILMVTGGEKTYRGQTFKDICLNNDCFDKSLTTCYELGQVYRDKLWAIAEYNAGNLSFNPQTLYAVCFRALTRLEQEDLTEVEIAALKLEALEEAQNQATLRANAKNLKKFRIKECDIHEAIAVLELKHETITPKPRRKKGIESSSNGGTGLNSKEQELQKQLVEQGKLLREERERRLALEANANSLEQEFEKEVEVRVQAQLKVRLQEAEEKLRNEMSARSAAIAQLDALTQENEKLRQRLESLETKNSVTVSNNHTNPPINSINIVTTVEVASQDAEPDFEVVLQKRQQQGFDIQEVDTETIMIEGVPVPCEVSILEGLQQLDVSLKEAIALLNSEIGDCGLFQSNNVFYWQIAGRVNSGTRRELTAVVFKTLGIASLDEYQARVNQFKTTAM